MQSILERVRAAGAAAVLPETGSEPPDANAVVRLVHEACAAKEPERALALWDEAGAQHDPAALDAALEKLAAGGWVPFVAASGRKRLREGARLALRSSSRLGTVELAAAILGSMGTKDDAADLETLARHPALTLHAVTALANLDHWQGRLALLRLLSTTNGAERVIVIDRLLPFIREPAVRLALVRDALVGLAPEHAAEVAADIAALCDVKGCVDDPKAGEDVKAGARLVLDHASRTKPNPES
jgi:hypothetical protein